MAIIHIKRLAAVLLLVTFFLPVSRCSEFKEEVETPQKLTGKVQKAEPIKTQPRDHLLSKPAFAYIFPYKEADLIEDRADDLLDLFRIETFGHPGISGKI